jgi:glycine dehydrogenase
MAIFRHLGQLGQRFGSPYASFSLGRRFSAPRISSSCSGKRVGVVGTQSRGNLTGPNPKVADIAKFRTLDDFARRHIGPDEQSTEEMLKALSPAAQSLDEFVSQVIPRISCHQEASSLGRGRISTHPLTTQ